MDASVVHSIAVSDIRTANNTKLSNLTLANGTVRAVLISQLLQVKFSRRERRRSIVVEEACVGWKIDPGARALVGGPIQQPKNGSVGFLSGGFRRCTAICSCYVIRMSLGLHCVSAVIVLIMASARVAVIAVQRFWFVGCKE